MSRPYCFTGKASRPGVLFCFVVSALLCGIAAGCRGHSLAHRPPLPSATAFSQPAPSQPAPSQPAPSQPAPSQPAPSQALPTAADLSRAETEERRAPQDARTHYTLAHVYIGLGHPEKGEAELQIATRLNPQFVPAFQALQRYYRVTDNLDREIATLRQLQKLEPQQVENDVRLGQIYLRLYWLDVANACLQQALRISPSDPAANLVLAKCEWESGRSSDAVTRLRKAHEVSPDDSETTSFLAQYLLATGRAPEAETVLREGLRRHPKDRLLMITLIYNLVHQGGSARCHEVVGLAEQFFQAYGPIAEVYCWLGHAYDQLGMPAEAEAAYQNSVRIDPSFENATYLLGRYYLRQGRTKEGRRLISFYAESNSHLQTYVHAEQRLRFHMNSPDAHRAVAQLDLLSRYYPEAIVEFKRVLELRPDDAAARAGLRKVLAALHAAPDTGSEARR